MAQQNPSSETIQSTPHLNLSAHTFAFFTLPFNRISLILNLFASDEAATHDLLVLDWINQTIVNLERQLDKNHWLAAQRLLTLLQHQSAQQLPQYIHMLGWSKVWGLYTKPCIPAGLLRIAGHSSPIFANFWEFPGIWEYPGRFQRNSWGFLGNLGILVLS